MPHPVEGRRRSSARYGSTQVPPLQSVVQAQAPLEPSQPQPLGAQPAFGSQVRPRGQPRPRQPPGAGSVQPAGEQWLPMQQSGRGGSHQQNAP